jgi:uncharacterized membrane protein YccC
MSKPTPQQLAQSVDPLTREYIEAHIRDLKAQADHAHNELRTEVKRALSRIAALESDTARSIKNIEHLIDHDPQFRITRARLAKLIKELDL